MQVEYANHFYRSAHKFEQICRHRLRRQNVGYSNFSQPQSHLSFCVLLQYLVERRRVVTQLGRSEERRVGKESSERFLVDPGMSLDLLQLLVILIATPEGPCYFFFKQKTAYEIGLGIPAEPLFRSINLSRFVVTGCAAKTSATVTFPSLNLISLFAFCFNIWLNGVAS